MAKKQRKKREVEEVNASSMADIAFLLLIFFLVTTTIVSFKGLQNELPPKIDKDNIKDVKIKPRNIFNVILNSKNQLLVAGEEIDFKNIEQLKKEAKLFITNEGKDPEKSVSPDKAIIFLKVDRGADFNKYLTVYDQLKAAYNELQAKAVGMDVEAYLALDRYEADDKKIIKKAGKKIPYRLSKAEPIDYSN